MKQNIVRDVEMGNRYMKAMKPMMRSINIDREQTEGNLCKQLGSKE